MNYVKNLLNVYVIIVQGLSNKNKPLYKICRSLYELKNHCRDRHKGEIEKCIINDALPDE